MLEATNKQLQNSYDEIRNEIQTKTKNIQVATIREQLINLTAQTNKYVNETTGLNIENGVKKDLLNAQLDNVRTNTANLIAKTLLTEQQTTLTELDVRNYEVKINNILADTKLKTYK